MRYALRRQRLQRQLLRLALRDDLTGLHNRRGFRLLAGQRLRLASRTRRSLLLFFADLDGLKQINDQFGHAEGDQALTRAAASFRRTFRKTDITARLGGDEFIALVVEEPGRNAQTICERLRMNLAKCGVRESRYDLSLSVGVARFSPEAAPSLQQLMTQADNALYLKKRTRVSHGDELKSALLSGRFPTGRFFNDAGTEAG
jgi:diguanylate cyclase (GGDEF)-like protein